MAGTLIKTILSGLCKMSKGSHRTSYLILVIRSDLGGNAIAIRILDSIALKSS